MLMISDRTRFGRFISKMHSGKLPLQPPMDVMQLILTSCQGFIRRSGLSHSAQSARLSTPIPALDRQ